MQVTPSKTFGDFNVTALRPYTSEPVQTNLLLKYFIITNNSAVNTATVNLYIQDVTGNLTRIAPPVILQSTSATYHISLIESEGNIVLYPNQKINLVVIGDVSAVFSLIPTE